MSDLAKIESDVISITPQMAVDQVLHIMNAVDFQRIQLRIIEQRLEQFLIEWVEANGDIVVGTKRYYVGTSKTTKCNNNAATLDALYRACEGEVNRVTECLASGAWKPGACKKTLPPEVFDKLFTTTEKQSLETGKPIKGLQVIDTKFLK